MEKLNNASDVVCLLTANSLNRPWLLYEAGVAKGKLDTPVYGVALGIPLSKANTGPFAQFQNCDDNEESLTKLIMQLIERIPGSEPDHDDVLMQVKLFKDRIKGELEKQPKDVKEEKKTKDEESIPKLFEEIKVMFQDLPNRIEKVTINPRTKRNEDPNRIIDYGEFLLRGEGDPTGILVLFSIFRENLPWIYEAGLDFWRAYKSDDIKKAIATYEEIRRMLEHTSRTDFLSDRRLTMRSQYSIREGLEYMLSKMHRKPKRKAKKTIKEKSLDQI
jgi:hypothetical protein